MAESVQRRRRAVTVGVVVVMLAVVAAVGLAYARPPASAAASYRTVTPSRGAVDQVVTTTGTLTPVRQVGATFPTSGRITAVLVAAGQKVTAGQKLATMDTVPLEAAVLDARATVAEDEVAIETDSSAVVAGTTASTAARPTSVVSTTAARTTTRSTARATTSATASRGGSGSAGAGGRGTTALLAAISSAQRLADQSCARVLSGLTTGGGGPTRPTASRTPSGSAPSTSASTTGSSASATSSAPAPASSSATGPSSTPSTSAITPSTSPTPSTSASATPTNAGWSTSGSASPGPSASEPPASGGAPTAQELTACLGALSRLAQAEHAAATALQASISTQGTAASRPTSASSTGVTAVRSGGAGSGTSGFSATSGQAAGSGTRAGSGGALTPAAQLIQDRGQLALDQQALSQATQHLAAATLTAPIAGVVAQVSLAKGSTATTSQGVTIIGPGTATVTTTVGLAQMPLIALGDSVHVAPVGSAHTLTGTVTTIGLLPASTSGSAPTYPVTVTVDAGTEGLPSGDVAQLSIVTTAVSDALTIPESAIVPDGRGAGTVTLLEAGSTSTVTISTGAVGGGRVQVLSGLATDATVVIANLAEPLPSNTGVAGRAGAAVGRITGRVGG